MFISSLKPYLKLMTGYTELRVQENRDLNIAYLKGNLVRNIKTSSSGVSARAYEEGSWGYASIPEVNDENIAMVINRAKQNAVFLNCRGNRGLGRFAPSSPVEHRDFTTKKQKLTQKQIMEFIKEVDQYIENKYPNLSSRVVSLKGLDMEKTLLTSDGASLYSMMPKTNIIIILTLEHGGQPISLFTLFGGLGEFEDHFNTPSDLYSGIDELYNHLVKKAEGVYAEAGVKECIVDSNLSGILAHEAIGHTTEADTVIRGSIAGEYLGKEVASPLISLVDFAHSYNNEVCHVPVYIDDEGTKAEDVVIIENGILKGLMHSKATAQHFNVAPTGNARAYLYSDEPLVRMRNTAILPGKSKLKDMIASIEDGYYLIESGNGQADSTSEFMFGVVIGYEIKKGKIARAIKDTTISGIAFDVLKTVSMVSDDMTWGNAGMCGKKQPITVSAGGPALKCKMNIGGR